MYVSKSTRLSLTMFVASGKDCLCSLGYLGFHGPCINLVRLVLQPALGSFCGWPFIECETFLRHPMKRYLQRCFNAREPPLFFTKDPAFIQLPRSSATILNNPSSTTAQAVKSRRCPNVSSIITIIASIMRTLLIMCGITVLLPMIGPHS